MTWNEGSSELTEVTRDHENNNNTTDASKGSQPDGNGRPEVRIADMEIRVTNFSPLFRQLRGAIGPIAAIISIGMNIGFSAILLPELQSPNSAVAATKNQSAWIASITVLSMALGCALNGLTMGLLGRRVTHQLLCGPFVLSWILLSFSKNVDMLYAGRFCTGLCVGLISPLCTVYIAETSGPKYRGPLLACVPLSVSVGILLTHVLGTLLHWQLVAGISAIFPCLCFIFITNVPESPSWLAARGRPQEAQVAFFWFRGYDDDATSEIQQLIKKYENEEQANTEEVYKRRNAWADQLKLVTDSSFVKPFLIMNVFFVVQQFSGVNAVTFYTVTILREFGGGVDEYLVTVVIDVVRVLMSVVACLLLRRLGRRPLAIASGVGTTLSLVGLATLLTMGTSHQSYTWLPSALFILYICSISIGLVPLPWLMIGEVYPAATRGLGSGLTSCWGFLVFFTVVQSLPSMVASLGSGGTFFVYAAVALCGTVFLYAALPETSNRTLQQIEESYSHEVDHSRVVQNVESQPIH